MVDWNHYLESICQDEYLLAAVNPYVSCDVRLDRIYLRPIERMVQVLMPAQSDDRSGVPSRERPGLGGRDDPDAGSSEVDRRPAVEALRDFAREHVLLRGRPGSGKTTTLKRRSR
ncbi:MAG: ATP-binding protein [Deltaproteobacteria bacterium]|nr:ATP-binding protein [Deltaproteobacteria bacterium]